MITLKRNDKIIIIAAIIVLAVASIGVAMYQSPKTSDITPPTSMGEKTFEITWRERNGSLSTVSEFAGKNAPYEGTVTIPVGNIKAITFNLSWADDRMTMLKRMGLDTLTLEVTTPDGRTFTESNTSAPISGEACITKEVTVGIIPPTTPIKADDEREAQTKLKAKPYYDDSWTDKDITIMVSVQVGEMRLLKKLRDKGNDFELKITYSYYEGVLKQETTVNTGFDNTMPPEDPWVEQQIPPYMSMIINTGCGRFV